MTSDARPVLKFAGPYCVIEQSDNLIVLEITPEGLEDLVSALGSSSYLKGNLYDLYMTLVDIKSKTQEKN